MKKSPEKNGASILTKAGLRITRQRSAIASILFSGAHKHMTAEDVHAALTGRGCKAALATVYNTLNQFKAAGLLSQVAVDATRVYFDTNTEPHYHFHSESCGKLTDIPAAAVDISKLPKPPKGQRLTGIDVIIRINDK